MPVLTIVAGPNGSGKSTLTKALDFDGRENLLDPDTIARRLNPANPRSATLAAGREMLRRIQEYLVQRISFAIETTLASKRTQSVIENAKARGFTVQLLFIGLDAPELAILRVQQRVLQGGHDVPDADVRRRYTRGLANLKEAIGAADRAIVYDNSENQHRKLLEVEQGMISWSAAQQSAWLTVICSALHSRKE